MMDAIQFESVELARDFENLKKQEPIAEVILEDGTVELFFLVLPSPETICT